MPSLLPEGVLPRISRRRDPRSLPQLDHIVVVAPPRISKPAWAGVPGAEALIAAARRRGLAKAGSTLTLSMESPCPVSVGFADPEASPFTLHTLARKLAGAALASRPGKVGVMTVGAQDPNAARWTEAVVLALLAGQAPMPRFKGKPEPRSHKLQTITLLDENPGVDPERLRAEAEGNHLARWLTALPPNKLDPSGYRTVLEELAGREGWELKFLDEAALAEAGAGAFLAVARASPGCATGRATGPGPAPGSRWSARASASTRGAPTSSPSAACSTCTATCRAVPWPSARC